VTAPRRRFRPTRAGIIGLWDYTNAVFGFAGGRMVLRGANGSGKTKALEVLFPFVLDGRLDPRRLDPFSGENRTMKDNLLWRGTDTGHGYAWLEFGCDDEPDAGGPGPDEDEVAGGGSGSDAVRYVTVVVGLQAQRHRPTPRSWFLLVDGRIGEDLDLVDPDGRPRTRRALIDELGDGAVVDRAVEHRRRVDEALFGLGPERYEAMLDLVLTLRRPMLAKDLDPRLLSETLTRGLRPLDDDLLEQVARSFDDLDAVQRDLDRLITAEEATRTFVTDYRGYLRTQARARADDVIEATAARARAEQRRHAAGTALDEARAAEALAEAEVSANADRLAEGRARRDALRATEAFRTAGQLEHLEQAVRDLAAEADRADRRASTAGTSAATAEEEREQATTAATRAAAEVARLRPHTSTSAEAAGVSWSTTDAEADGDAIRQRVRGRVAARRADLDAVRVALDDRLDADRGVAAAEAAVDRAEAADEQATEALDAAERAVATTREQLDEAVTTWAGTHSEVVDTDDLEAVRAAVAAVGDDGAAPPVQVWQDRLAVRRATATDERARHRMALSSLTEQADALAARRQQILDERDDAPPATDWRGGGRDARAGAPLWRLVRFVDDLPDGTAAGIEAALEATGLLDAWVRPDGRAEGDELDAFLLLVDDGGAGSGVGDDPAGTLAEVLVPEEQDDVPRAVVQRLLGRITLSDATGGNRDAAVTADGRYRLGPLAGRHEVAAPRYVGATARAAHRAARVTAMDAELAELRAETTAVEATLGAVDAWLAAADAATATLPSTAALQGRLRARDLAAGQRHQARDALGAAREAAEAARRHANDRRAALEREARARALPPTADGVAAVAVALDGFADDGDRLATAVGLAHDRNVAAAGAQRRAAEALAAVEAARTDAVERHRQHDARAVELATLRDRMGADVQAVLDELGEVEAGIARDEAASSELAERIRATAAARGQAEGELTAAGEAVTSAAEQVTRAAARLAVLAHRDLAGPLGLEVPDADDGTALLDAVDELVTGVSGAEERRKAAQTRITRGLEELDQALGAGYRPAWDVEDDLIVVTVADDLGVRSVAAFADQLATQRTEQESLLTQRERALFEDALLTSVCGQIHARTQATRELVSTMDTEMRARRLSSGQTVGVAWRADDTVGPDWKQVHRLLDQDPAHFGPDQLDILRRHFSADIKGARAAEPQAPYRELLATVLDYRRWRRFELSLVEADGSQAPLTRARHARLSGGEKAASLHLPLFAAAHAAFAVARPTCPRLLGLDEAFAGIDDQGRSELLSLTVTFDLDLFMTGYDLWAVDRDVPAVAHHDLLHLPDAHAVSSLLILWHGGELVEGPDADQALVALGGALHRSTAQA
jgi:uncharacterized protein (TIGR02680 family)